MSHNIRIIYPQYEEGREEASTIPKGLAVRLELFIILDLLDSNNFDISQSYLVLIDGSRALHYDNIYLTLDKLINKRYLVILGKRPAKSPDWCMGNDIEDGKRRKSVELFEKFLLEQKYQKKLLDAQCGCWGLNLGVTKSLALTARNYGLEFDVIASALEAKLRIAFTNNLACGDRLGGSDFKPEDGINKMKFILYKLGYSKRKLSRLLDNYKQLPNYRDKELPQDYENQLMEFINN